MHSPNRFGLFSLMLYVKDGASFRLQTVYTIVFLISTFLFTSRTIKACVPSSGASKNSHAVILVTIMGVFLSVVQFPAFNGFRDRAERPGNAPLAVEFLLSFLAQFSLRDKSGHAHHLPSFGAGQLYHGKGRTAILYEAIPGP